MSFFDHIRRCNQWQPADYRPFVVADRRVGRVRHAMAERLAAFPAIFSVTAEQVTLSDRLTDGASRTAAMRDVVARLQADGALPRTRGEDYAVMAEWGETPVMLLDRGIVSAFGVRAFGVHVNGFVRTAGTLRLWIGRRAPNKTVEPNKLDNMVAGGQPAGLSLMENVIKESAEEADLPRDLAAQAIPVGAITYCMENGNGLKPDTLFVYDLELPADFVPRNTDGELSGFTLMDVDDVAEKVRSTREFKFNVALVIIDFLIRHGRLTPDSEPGYLDLVAGLHTAF